MSQMEDAIYEQFKEDGTADWINQQVKNTLDETAATTEAPVEDTDEVEEVEDVEEDSADDEIPADVGTDDEVEPEGDDAAAEDAAEDEGLFIDLTPETEALLNEKYGGDLNKMLQAATEAQSLIGRQGNELGDLRAEMQALRGEVQAGLNRPTITWPDEDAMPEEAVPQYRQIAEQATNSQDEPTLNAAIAAWHEIDPNGAEAWATMKYTQLLVEEARTGSGTPPPTQSLEDGVAELAKTYPQLGTPEFQAEVGKELERFPTLQRTFQDMQAPPTERLAALEEAARLVASRQVDGDVRQAVRRVQVKTSEEARKSRAEARVATGGGRGKSAAPEDRMIKVGATGQTVGAGELQARIKELTGMDITVGS